MSVSVNSPELTVHQRRRGRWPWRIHALLGLWLAAILAVVCATGTVATVSHELLWVFSGVNRATISAKPVSLGDRWDAARAAYPALQPRSLSVTGTASNRETYLATIIRGRDRDGSELTVYVDPGTGVVNGAISGVNFPSLMRGLHYYLLDPDTDLLFYTFAIAGVLMGVMAATGLLVYKKWWRGFLHLPQRDKPVRIWWGQFHRFLALWSLPFLLIIHLTVIWYLIEWDTWVDWNQWGTEITSAHILPPERYISGTDIDKWVAIADREMPGLNISNISLPWENGTPVLVTGQWQAVLVRERANAVAIDPVTDVVLHRSIAHDMPLSERWTHTADPLHMGDFAGLWSKLFWVIFGSGLTLLSVTGMVVCYRRLALIQRQEDKRKPAASGIPS